MWSAHCLSNQDQVYSHASHAQNANYSHLRLTLHVQLGDKENRQNSNGEITECGECTVDVCHDDNDVDADAVALNLGVHGSSRPEVREWLALQEHEEKENDSSNDCEDHNRIEGPDV
jgi:hypothetical protein